MIGDIELFERLLLRRGLGLLAADRHACVRCGRTPLVGERVHQYERESGVVCDLCRPRRHELPQASRIVRHSEFGHTVRPTARAA